MPFTPFHFGPHACIALPLRQRIDLPVFLLANVAVDLEPLFVLTLNLDYPVHGYCHTFLMGTWVGAAFGALAFPFAGLFKYVMDLLRLRYEKSFARTILSGALGVWLHVLFDAPLYADIRPFFPFDANPLYRCLSPDAVHGLCTASFPVALVCYLVMLRLRSKES
jgi:membrane-bound metal-dependent hydrolase YbcI (DUF457 family)